MPYATIKQLAAYLGSEASVTDDDRRLLLRATELVQTLTTTVVPVPDEPEAADCTFAQMACRAATLAQVEYWHLNSEGLDTEPGLAGIAAGKVSQQFANGQRQRTAPRALDALDRASLRYRGASTR